MGVPLPSQALTPNCELCRAPANVLCPSDDAYLCRHCDSLVHSANFLVARHHRTFLCGCCARPTVIGASGASLPAASLLCVNCQPMTEVDDLFCGSISESTDCNSEVISDCDYEMGLPCSIPMTGSSVDKFIQPLRSSSQSDAFSDVDEEELSSADLSPFPPCGAVQDVEGYVSSALAEQNWTIFPRRR